MIGRVVGNGLLVLLGLGCAALVFEIGLHLSWQGYYLKERKAYARPHPTRGWENRPSIRVPFGKPEFSTVATHNAVGFRGPEVSREKRPDGFRILALGDSFTYGVGVEDEETFSAQLAAQHPRFEVLNAGVNAYGTSQELLLLREVGLAHQPDLVLLGFFWNDVADSATRGFPAFSVEDGVLRDPPRRGAAAPPLVRWPKPRQGLLRHSHAYRFLSDRFELLGWRIRLALGLPVDDPTHLEANQVEPAWALVHALLREMALDSREAGAAFLIAVIPDQSEVEPVADLELLGLRPADLAVRDRLLAFGREAGVEVIDLLPGLLEAAAREEGPLYYRKDRHLTAAGHRAVATILGREIEARRLR